jgi:hypothetical protein
MTPTMKTGEETFHPRPGEARARSSSATSKAQMPDLQESASASLQGAFAKAVEDGSVAELLQQLLSAASSKQNAQIAALEKRLARLENDRAKTPSLNGTAGSAQSEQILARLEAIERLLSTQKTRPASAGAAPLHERLCCCSSPCISAAYESREAKAGIKYQCPSPGKRPISPAHAQRLQYSTGLATSAGSLRPFEYDGLDRARASAPSPSFSSMSAVSALMASEAPMAHSSSRVQTAEQMLVAARQSDSSPSRAPPRRANLSVGGSSAAAERGRLGYRPPPKRPGSAATKDARISDSERRQRFSACVADGGATFMIRHTDTHAPDKLGFGEGTLSSQLPSPTVDARISEVSQLTATLAPVPSGNMGASPSSAGAGRTVGKDGKCYW